MPFNVFLLSFLIFSSSLFARPLFQEPWGRDSDRKIPPKRTQTQTSSLATRVADAVIRFHQEVISPVDGPRSSFRPSSSRYMQLAMQRYGFVKGFIMGCDRLLRENDEKWVYPTILVDGQEFKFDPALSDKYLPLKKRA
ncbi:MAG TPA: membrane protein insertion efficiency factor YidD [Parachlamydiales bacterium]|nr:membrane protein insertion efficiency factor YidD [Parachlamydiales bacterium]